MGIENITVITIIEKLLPANLMRYWALIRQKLEEKDPVFAELMKFFINERKVIEYLEENFRKLGSASSKVTIDSVVKQDSEETQTGYVHLIQQMQNSQENQSKQFNECLSNLTVDFNNLSQSGSKSHNSNNYPN